MASRSEGGYFDLSLSEFLSRAAAASPSPASAAAAAVAGCIACAMAEKAANLTITSKRYADARDEMERRVGRLRDSQAAFRDLLDCDCQAIERFMEAWRMPKGSPEKQERMNLVRATAIEIPLEMLAVSLALLEEVQAMLPRCNPNLVAELSAAAALAEAAARAAAASAAFHLPGLPDRTAVDRTQAEIAMQLGRAETIRREVDDGVGGVNRCPTRREAPR